MAQESEIPNTRDIPTDFDETPLSDAENYFDHGKIEASRFAKDLVEHLGIITVIETDEIFFWNGGCYEGGPSGENSVRSWQSGILRDRLLDVSQQQVNETIHHVRLWSYRPLSVFDADPELLPLSNGVLNILTLEFEQYRKDKHHFLFQLPVRYDIRATCPKFEKFVSEIVYAGDIPVVQEIFGYCLWRNGTVNIKKAIMLLGSGNNGKSLLCTLLEALLGADNVSAISLSNLSENRFASARLRGKLANINPDLPDRALRETGIFKGLLGDDLIAGEIKHGGQFEFLNQAKLVFSANKLPASSDDSDAYYDRWTILNFPYKFVVLNDQSVLGEHERPAKNKNGLKADLLQELSGILNWSLIGLKRLRENGNFSNGLSTEKTRDLYTRLSNSCKAFVADECIFTGQSNDYISKDEFYQRYSVYCQNQKLAPMTKEKIGRMLASYFPGRVEPGRDYVGKDRVTTWRSIRFRTEEEKADVQQTLDH